MRDHYNRRIIYERFRRRFSNWSEGLLRFLLWCSLIQLPAQERVRVARVRRTPRARRKE